MNRFERTMYWYFQNQAVRRLNQMIQEDFGEEGSRLILKDREPDLTPSALMETIRTGKNGTKYASQILACAEFFREITAKKLIKWAAVQKELQENHIYTTISGNRDGDTLLAVNGSEAEIFLWRGPKPAKRKDAVSETHLIRDGRQVLDLNSNTSDVREIVSAVRYFLGYAPERFDGKGLIGETAEQEITETDDERSASFGIGITGKAITQQAFGKEPPVYTEEDARNKLYGFLVSARKNFEEAVGLDSLIHAAEKSSAGTFHRHPNEDIRSLQDKLWEKMMNETKTPAEREEACRRTLEKETLKRFGNLPEPEAWDKTFPVFDAVETAEWMECHEGTAARLELLKHVMRTLKLKPDDITGVKLQNELVYFDEEHCRSLMEEPASAFMNSVAGCIREAVQSSGLTLKSLDIDAHGVIRCCAERMIQGTAEAVTVYLGQVFEPDPVYGCIKTAFAAENKYLLVPGYTAVVLPPEDPDNEYGTLGSRTRLIGFEQILFQRMRRQLRKDLFRKSGTADSGTVLNSIYSDLILSRHDPDYLDNITDETDRILREAVIKTERGMVRYSDSLRENAGILNEDEDEKNYWQTMLGKEKIKTVDGVEHDIWYNISLLSDTTSGYFDLIATGSGQNQGVIRFLADGASVDPLTRKIIPAEKDGHCALLNLPWLRYLHNSPFDRQQMVFSNLRTAHHVTEPVGMAQMTFGGWNFDDGFVVSRKFAETYKVPRTTRDQDGNAIKTDTVTYRPLQVGDKICDFAGNKGVITLIADPDMTDEAAMAEDSSGSVKQAVQWFRANPNLQVVGAPFTAPSRLNGGSALECREHSEDLVKPDGEHVPHAIGYARFIITHYTADAKTKPYGDVTGGKNSEEPSDPAIAETGLDEEFNAPEQGRRVSAQLAWGLAAADAQKVLHEFYGHNDRQLIELRELLILLGFDLDENGKLKVGYHPHKGEPARRIIRIPEDDWEVTYTRQEKINIMMAEIAQYGGFLELPFELDYPQPHDKDLRKAYRKARPAGQGKLMPVLSIELRKAFMNSQDQMQRSEYTRYYQRIVQNLVAAEDSRNKDKYYDRIRRIWRRLVHDVLDKRINAKDNVFKNSIMASIAKLSATAIWSADPTLNLDEVAVSKDLMKRLGLHAYTDLGVPASQCRLLLWRDPILRSGGIRYMNVVKGRDGLTGIAVNPFADKSFDGDFDGDTIGIVRLQDLYASAGEYASEDAYEKLSHRTNLLDIGAGKNSDGLYSLFFNHSLDFKAVENERAAAGDDSLKKEYEAITVQANRVYADYLASGDADAYGRGCDEVLKRLNDYVHQVFADDYGRNIIRYDADLKEHMATVYQMTDKGSGAKGKAAGLKEYIYYLGYEGGDLAAGVFDDLHVRNASETEHSDYLEKLRETEYATAVKSVGTGVAGAFSQRGIAVLRNECPDAVTELTYPVTQAVLQAKHDSARARVLLGLISNECRRLWAGVPYDRDDNTPLSAEEWTDAFLELYRSEKKLNVGNISEDHIRTAADYMKDEAGQMRSIEAIGVAEELGSPLDILAYLSKRRTYEFLVRYAAEGRDLFRGRFTSLFRPDILREGSGFWAADTVAEE